jgi:hypothetical protein
MSKKNAKRQKPRKLYFRFLKSLMHSRYKEPAFIYLGEKIGNGSLILSNHEGTDAPMSLELYLDAPIRMWGTGEMNADLATLYRYQSRVYYHEKKHWNIHLARLFCLIASPLTMLFYSGLDLISTYKDAQFVKTISETIESIKQGDNIVIYPEVSEKGYLAELVGFHEGVVMLCEICKKRGIDLPIHVTYFKRNELLYIIDKPVMYSELSAHGESRADIARALCDRCNELGRMPIDPIMIERAKEEQGITEKDKIKKGAKIS